MSIQIAVGRKHTIDLGEFGGVPSLTRFSFDNRNPELIQIKQGIILPLKIGTARLGIYDSATGKSTTKIYNIINPAHLRCVTVPQKGVLSRKTDRTHVTIAYFSPTSSAGQQPLQVSILDNVWKLRLGQDSSWLTLAPSTTDINGDPQAVWPGSEGIVYNSNFGTLWLVFDPTPPLSTENNVDILTWQRFTESI